MHDAKAIRQTRQEVMAAFNNRQSAHQIMLSDTLTVTLLAILSEALERLNDNSKAT